MVTTDLEQGLEGKMSARIGKRKDCEEIDITRKLPKERINGCKKRFAEPTEDELVKMFLDLRLRPVLPSLGLWDDALDATKESLEEYLIQQRPDLAKRINPTSPVSEPNTAALKVQAYHTGGADFLVTTKASAAPVKTSRVDLVIDADTGQEVFTGNVLQLLKENCPFEWWMARVKNVPTLKPLAELACGILSHPTIQASLNSSHTAVSRLHKRSFGSPSGI